MPEIQVWHWNFCTIDHGFEAGTSQVIFGCLVVIRARYLGSLILHESGVYDRDGPSVGSMAGLGVDLSEFCVCGGLCVTLCVFVGMTTGWDFLVTACALFDKVGTLA